MRRKKRNNRIINGLIVALEVVIGAILGATITIGVIAYMTRVI